MRTTIKAKMIISFLLILAFSCAVTFFGALAISIGPITEEMRANQFSYADSLLRLQSQTSLSTQEILEVNVNSTFTTRVMDEVDKAALDQDTITRLANGEKVLFLNKLYATPYTLIRMDHDIVKISVRRHDGFEVFRFRIALIILTILVLSCIILALASNRMLKPILKLTAATQKLARGDFDVKVDIESRDEIGVLIKNFNRMAEELGRMEYLQKDFVRNVSHEFKTPIASIQGFAKLLQNKDLPEKERLEFSGIILEETERLSQLSANILRLSKLENQKEPAAGNAFALDEQIRAVIVLLEPKWSQKKLNFHVQLEKLPYTGDEELLQQVWINLIENAIKFSNIGGDIAVTASGSERAVEVEIADNGPGMDEETQQRIFDRFYQGNASHSSEGSGLGLSIVKRILELNSGEIQVKSSPNQGTSFLVRLPR